MNPVKLLLSATALISLMHAAAVDQPADSIVCHISGTVIDRPESKRALLLEYGSDLRVTGAKVIKISDGKFSYDLKTDVPRQYEIIFDDELSHGGWTIKSFFVDNGDVELISYNDELSDSNRVVSSLPDNIAAARWQEMYENTSGKQLRAISDEIDSLYSSNLVYTEPLKQLMARYDNAESGTALNDSLKEEVIRFFKKDDILKYTPGYLSLKARQLDVLRLTDSLTINMIEKEPSLFGLSKIKSALQEKNEWNDISRYADVFNTVYRDAMAYHPYTADIIMALDATKIVKGNRYPDFTLTRPDGTTARVANLIKGKIAVIDLWASWCGPCRRHSIELIPLYEQYRDKGFTIVAVARESNNCDAMNEAMKKDGYPWESFVDLNDRGKIWKMNDAGNAGGRIILVDADGIIVETDADTATIANFLKQNLQ